MASVLAAMPLSAQEAETIEEIQVTATRRPTGIENVSSALTLIPADRVRQGKLVTDALLAEPGIFLQQTTPGQGAAIVRGLKGSEVLHLVDGMRLNNAIFRNAPTQYLALVAPGGVERIEVVRGAPSSLYGSDAVGGVLQVLTQKPAFGLAAPRGSVFLGYDTAELGKVVRASVEHGNERVAGIVSGEYLRTGNRRVGGGERIAPTGYESKGGRIALSVAADEQSSWLFDLQFARQPATPRIDELVSGYGETEPSSSEFLFAPNDRAFAHVNYSLLNGWWDATWTVDAGWQRIVDNRVSRNFESSVRRHEDNSSDLFGLTASAAGEIVNGDYILGVEFYHDRVESRREEEDINTGGRTTVLARFPDGATVDQAAVYGNLAFDVGDRHRLSAGLRASAVSTELPASGPIAASTSEQDDLSADLGWVFDATDEWQVTANLGYGFRAPNVFDLGALGERPGNRFNIPNPNLESERITQLDLGLRRRGERFDIDLTAFTLHYTDRIASALTGATTPAGRDVVQTQNVASADIHGVEGFVRWHASDVLDAEFVVNWQHGDQAGEDGVDTPADRMPPLNGRLGLRYQFNDAWQFEPFIRFADRQDRLSPRDIRDGRINPAGTPGWVTVNIAASWSPDDRWMASARLENLLDQAYRQHGSGIDATGRNLLLSVTYGW